MCTLRTASQYVEAQQHSLLFNFTNCLHHRENIEIMTLTEFSYFTNCDGT